MAFCVDRRRRIHGLRLFDINDFRLLFECEIYINMHLKYRVLKPNFHCFHIPKVVLGLEFSNEMDAKFFKILVDEYSPKMEITKQMSSY